jgi:non-specific serine/threonine protein kinase
MEGKKGFLIMFSIVFNLYPFSEHLFLPSVNIVQADKQGQLLHILQKANPLTIMPFGIELTPMLQRLFQVVDSLTPKSLESKFRAPKAKTVAPLATLLSDPATKSIVEGFIYREMDQLLGELVRNRFPLTLDAERKSLAKDVLIAYPTEELLPHLSFRKTTEGVEYRLQLGTEEEKWSIRDREVRPLTNTEPAWILADYALFRVPGINGNMVRPFRQKDVIHIPPDKVRTYFRQFIAKNAGRTRIEAEGFAMQTIHQLLATRIEPTENVLEKNWLLKPVFEYDGAFFHAGEKRDKVTSVDFAGDETEEIVVRQVCRDAATEAERMGQLTALGLVRDGRMYGFPPDDPGGLDALIHWMARNRKALEAGGFTLVLPEIEGRTIAISEANLTVRSDARGDWFDVYGQLIIGAFTFPFRALLSNIRKGDRFFPLPDGTVFLIPEEWLTRYADLARAGQEGEDDKIRLPKALFTLIQSSGLAEGDSAADLPLIDPEQIEYTPSPDLKATLRPYQLLGVKWLVGHYRHGFGACLADDMGLGKTLQTIAVLLHAKTFASGEDGSGAQLDLFQSYKSDLKPLQALIILPASLVFNWQQELMRFAPSLFVYAHSGPKRLKDARAMSGYDVVLTTYHTARADLELLRKINWHYMVLDESQQIKNRDSEVSKVVRSLEAQNKISLSGTPIENSLADLWTQMEFINPDTLGTFRSFKEEFLNPIEKQDDAKARERLFSRVRPFFMRRTKEQVAPELPELTRQIFYSEMQGEQRKRYEALKSAVRNEILSLFDDPKTRIQALAALTRLRQMANHPVLADGEYGGGSGKFEDVLAQWDTVRRAGHKVLFFSSFEKHLQLFRKVFESTGSSYAWLTGDTATADRAREVTRFQNDPSVQAFFMTIKAGGVGLNLTAADYVFVLDPWWNPAVEEQAIARAHRIGQQRPVTALRFISRDTIEEKIRELQERKRVLGKDLFGSGEEMPKLGREDLEMLLG